MVVQPETQTKRECRHAWEPWGVLYFRLNNGTRKDKCIYRCLFGCRSVLLGRKVLPPVGTRRLPKPAITPDCFYLPLWGDKVTVYGPEGAPVPEIDRDAFFRE